MRVILHGYFPPLYSPYKKKKLWYFKVNIAKFISNLSLPTCFFLFFIFFFSSLSLNYIPPEVPLVEGFPCVYRNPLSLPFSLPQATDHLFFSSPQFYFILTIKITLLSSL